MAYVIIFEAVPNPGREADYLAIATPLNDVVSQQPGFLSIDRSKSIMTEGKLVSISHWESEAAIDAWLAHPLHREAQEKARQGIFSSIRITRLQVISRREIPISQRELPLSQGDNPILPRKMPAGKQD